MSRKTETTRAKKRGGGWRAIKKPNWKRRKGIKTLRKKRKGVNKKNSDKKAIKEKELKIMVLAHELLASTLSYLMLTLGDTPILQILA
jgi:hypothetical protein